MYDHQPDAGTLAWGRELAFPNYLIMSVRVPFVLNELVSPALRDRFLELQAAGSAPKLSYHGFWGYCILVEDEQGRPYLRASEKAVASYVWRADPSAEAPPLQPETYGARLSRLLANLPLDPPKADE